MVTFAANYGPLRKVAQPQQSFGEKIRRGSFSKVERILDDGTLLAREWLFCREYFQDDSHGVRRMLFCHAKNRSVKVASFIGAIENKLGIEHSEFGPTQRNNITWINVSPWWTYSSMRRSLFTILLRAGQRYCPAINNVETALKSEPYSKNTYPAVDWFLRGHTKYTGNLKGWYSQFGYGKGNWENPVPPTAYEIRQLLVRP
jgi:hypothetical protein